MTHQADIAVVSSTGASPEPPRLSVLLSYYNLEQYLSEAIQSIRDQTFSDFELLLLDDGSTDASPTIAKQHAAADSRIRIVRSETNTGISANLNRGLRQSSADWIALMDGDDISHPERFERQISYLANNTDLICVGCFPLMIDELRNPIGVLDIYREHHEDIEQLLLQGHGWAFLPPSAIIRRDIALQIGGYREDLVTAMDLDFFLRVCESGRIANVPDVLYEYRLRTKSVTHAANAGRIARHNQMLAEAYQRRGLAGPPPEGLADHELFKVVDLHLRWGWLALSHGYPLTARRQGLLALRRAPWSPVGWRLLACAFRDLLKGRRPPV
jgi:glycosyltransferase involved in cell wall biosynthesis